MVATTLAAALSSTGTSLTLTSAAGCAPNKLALIDREIVEFMTVNFGTGVCTVRRGKGGIQAAHASGATVDHGAVGEFYESDPPSRSAVPGSSGSPYINRRTGSKFVESASEWQHVDQVYAAEAATVADLSITTGKLALVSVTTSRIADANITEAKIATGAVTEGKIGAAAVGADKLKAALGATAGPFTTITSITVVNGIVTALEGS